MRVCCVSCHWFFFFFFYMYSQSINQYLINSCTDTWLERLWLLFDPNSLRQITSMKACPQTRKKSTNSFKTKIQFKTIQKYILIFFQFGHTSWYESRCSKVVKKVILYTSVFFLKRNSYHFDLTQTHLTDSTTKTYLITYIWRKKLKNHPTCFIFLEMGWQLWVDLSSLRWRTEQIMKQGRRSRKSEKVQQHRILVRVKKTNLVVLPEAPVCCFCISALSISFISCKLHRQFLPWHQCWSFYALLVSVMEHD